PRKFFVQTHRELAQSYLQSRKYSRARRSLTLALKCDPDNASLHYLLATALSSGKKADVAGALEHYHRALELEPDHADWLAECGLLEVKQGLKKMAPDHLQRAAQLSADDPDILDRVVTGLRLANQAEEARQFLLAARFRNPKNSQIR